MWSRCESFILLLTDSSLVRAVCAGLVNVLGFTCAYLSLYIRSNWPLDDKLLVLARRSLYWRVRVLVLRSSSPITFVSPKIGFVSKISSSCFSFRLLYLISSCVEFSSCSMASSSFLVESVWSLARFSLSILFCSLSFWRRSAILLSSTVSTTSGSFSRLSDWCFLKWDSSAFSWWLSAFFWSKCIILSKIKCFAYTYAFIFGNCKF